MLVGQTRKDKICDYFHFIQSTSGKYTKLLLEVPTTPYVGKTIPFGQSSLFYANLANPVPPLIAKVSFTEAKSLQTLLIGWAQVISNESENQK